MTSGSTSRSARALPLTLPLRGSLSLPACGKRVGVRGFWSRVSLCLLGLIGISAVTVEAAAASPAVVEAAHGMVVTAQRYASEIGAGILTQGGNAIDAAVAVGYVLAV